MFWNKKLYDMHVVDTSLQDLKRQMDEIDRIYSKPENACENMTISRFAQDAESYHIVESYYVKSKQLARLTKDVRDLRAVVEDNGEYWGSYQRNYKECQQRLANAELHLNLEKEMYQKLYERNRELETKLYMAEREIAILKGSVK